MSEWDANDWTYEATAGGGCKVWESYEGTNRYEVVDENGVSQIATAYDASGVQTNVDLYAPKGCGGIWNYTNVHHVVRLYDTQGNEVEQRFYGLGDVPTVGNFDVHRIGRSYATVAGESREVAEWYLDGNGEPMTNRIGVTRGTVDYNSQGRMVQLMGFAPKGRGGIMGYETAHQFVGKFNAGGDLIERSFFDESGNPVQGENNAHCTRWKYEMIAGKSRQVAEWYLDEWGREVADKNGVVRRLTEYDQSGTKTRADLYAPQGRGGIWKHEKVHHVITKYDEVGNEVEMSFWNSNEEPTRGKLDGAVLQAEYFAPGKIKKLIILDENRQPTFEKSSGISRLTVEYGDGNCVCKLELHAVEGGVLTLTGIDKAVRFVAKPVAGKDSYEMTVVDRHGTTVMRKNVAGRIPDLLGGFTLQTL